MRSSIRKKLKSHRSISAGPWPESLMAPFLNLDDYRGLTRSRTVRTSTSTVWQVVQGSSSVCRFSRHLQKRNQFKKVFVTEIFQVKKVPKQFSQNTATLFNFDHILHNNMLTKKIIRFKLMCK